MNAFKVTMNCVGVNVKCFCRKKSAAKPAWTLLRINDAVRYKFIRTNALLIQAKRNALAAYAGLPSSHSAFFTKGHSEGWALSATALLCSPNLVTTTDVALEIMK